MREAEFHVPSAAIEAMGFDVPPGSFRGGDVRSVTLVSCDERRSLVAVTYSRPVDGALTDSDSVEWWERLDDPGPGVTYLCETVAPDLRGEATRVREQQPAVRSVTVVDDGYTVTLVGSHEALQCDGAFDERVGDLVTLRRLTDYRGPRDDLESLTPRQREVLETAHELGYYEVPRETTADEVARRLDLDRSTVTEHLQRAERNLLSAVLD